MYNLWTWVRTGIRCGPILSSMLAAVPALASPGGSSIPALMAPYDPVELPNPICAECRLGAEISEAASHAVTLTIEYLDEGWPSFNGTVYVDAVLPGGARRRVAARTPVLMTHGLTYDLWLVNGEDWSWPEVEQIEVTLVAD